MSLETGIEADREPGRLKMNRCPGPRRQRPESRQLLLRRGAGLGRGEPGAVDLAQLFRDRAAEGLVEPGAVGRRGRDPG